ncbi:response regulator [Nisaea acidiphila]|uniref:Response regulator n=1 Tax=Nisaea acidiphila TaxID=1862145 RepID=A0A9J7AVT4_9PROT|nr:response regulator [Nisaea acidiphila]UUX49533.1 response regulator [Nisaea acidiphila]
MPSILIVDDDKPLRDLLATVLQEQGYDVETAEEGNAALTWMESAAFDLVISDIIMPGKEGIETIREIRSLYPSVLIIAMSTGGSLGNAQILEYARMIGAHEAIRKPVEIPVLIDTISRMLQ